MNYHLTIVKIFPGPIDPRCYVIGGFCPCAHVFNVSLEYISFWELLRRILSNLRRHLTASLGVSYGCIAVSGLVCIASNKLDSFSVGAGLWQGCPLLLILFINFMDSISRQSQVALTLVASSSRLCFLQMTYFYGLSRWWLLSYTGVICS